MIGFFLVECNDSDIRLADGSNSQEGRVEVCYDGVWGTVCSDGFGAVDASVVCRQLGYSSSGTRVQLFALYHFMILLCIA